MRKPVALALTKNHEIMKNNYLKYTADIAICIFMASCCGIYENGSEMAKDASFGIKQIAVEDLKAKMENDDIFTLLDVREPAEFQAG